MLLNTGKHKALSPEDFPVPENLQLQLYKVLTLTAPSKNTKHLQFCFLSSNLLHKIENTPAVPCICCMFLFRIKDKIWMIFFIWMKHLYNCEHVSFQDDADVEPDRELFSATSDLSQQVEGWVCEKAAQRLY